MSVRQSLLAILAERPAHGYGLKSTFEKSTARAWPLNVGQVYTTLSRLERDGLVRPRSGNARSDRDLTRRSWAITPAGRDAVEGWYASPVDDRPVRDELAIKVLLAVAAESVDVSAILQRQRSATVARLQAYVRDKQQADPEDDLSWILLLDALILKAEAEIKWLDLCEQRLRHRRESRSTT